MIDKSIDSNPLHSWEAEASVIGAVLMDNALFQDLDLKIGDFYTTDHRRLWEMVVESLSNGLPCDLVTIGASDSHLGGIASEILTQLPTTANIAYHADIVKDRAWRRAVLRQSQSIIQNIHNDNLERLLDFSELKRDDKINGTEAYSDIVKKAVQAIEHRYEHRDELSGIPSGFRDLDEVTDGWQPEFIILAGRPSMGKTAFMESCIRHAASMGSPGHIVNIDMTNQTVTRRALAAQAGIDIWKLRKARLEKEEWTALYDAAKGLMNLPITMDDVSFRVSAVVKSIKQAVKNGAKLIAIDYIQLIDPETMGASAEREVSRISIAIKHLCHSLKVPVIALAQLSRDCEKRENKRPIPSDLRHSGQLEQDADVVLFLYRDCVYNKNANPNHAELIIAKGRDIGLAPIELYFNQLQTKFGNWEGER